MAKQTLLELVQNILSSMDSDEVNSITDTVESLQVATIVKETYDDLVSNLNIPERKVLFQLDALADPDHPNYLTIPSTIRTVDWLKYNGVDVSWLEPSVFFDMIFRNPGGHTVIDPDRSISYAIFDDADPKYFTSLNDTTLVFDSFNLANESTLTSINSIGFGSLVSDFLLDDDTIPDLDDNWFPTLLAEAKTSCFVNLKQVSNSKEETRARRGLVRIQNELSKVKKPAMDRLPDYGRRR